MFQDLQEQTFAGGCGVSHITCAMFLTAGADKS